MSFWDSQILGVIVGGFIGGFGKLYHEIRSENRLKTNLERGIKSEIKILKNFAESSHQILNAYFEALNRDGKVKITYKIKGASFLSFANANLEKLGILDEDILSPLIEVKAVLDVTENAISKLYDTSDRVSAGQAKTSTLDSQLQSSIASFNKMKELCDQILSHESANSTFWTIIKYIKNIFNRKSIKK